MVWENRIYQVKCQHLLLKYYWKIYLYFILYHVCLFAIYIYIYILYLAQRSKIVYLKEKSMLLLVTMLSFIEFVRPYNHPHVRNCKNIPMMYVRNYMNNWKQLLKGKIISQLIDSLNANKDIAKSKVKATLCERSPSSFAVPYHFSIHSLVVLLSNIVQEHVFMSCMPVTWH